MTPCLLHYAEGKVLAGVIIRQLPPSMPSALRLMLQHPVQTCNFLYCFAIQLLLFALHRILLPTYPRYHSVRIEAQKAYLSSTSLHFPTLTHRLPATYSEQQATPITGKGWNGYIISGETPHSLAEATDSNVLTVVLYAHGGGYVRGEARMYLWYFKRWIAVAKTKGLEIIFVSVEYRTYFRCRFMLAIC